MDYCGWCGIDLFYPRICEHGAVDAEKLYLQPRYCHCKLVLCAADLPVVSSFGGIGETGRKLATPQLLIIRVSGMGAVYSLCPPRC